MRTFPSPQNDTGKLEKVDQPATEKTDYQLYKNHSKNLNLGQQRGNSLSSIYFIWSKYFPV